MVHENETSPLITTQIKAYGKEEGLDVPADTEIKAQNEVTIDGFDDRDDQHLDKENDHSDEDKMTGCLHVLEDIVLNLYRQNEFVAQIIFVVLLAKACPTLGAKYLYPEITSTWLAVSFMFVLAGIGLKTEEFSKAFQRLKFNTFVQTFNFGVVSLFVYIVSRLLAAFGLIGRPLADGMVICSCLPITISMVLVLTKTSGGDEASAVCNAAFGNLVGVFLSPLLILSYLGVSGNIDIWNVFYKLSLRVVTPLMVGQILRSSAPTVANFHKAHKKDFKQAQQLALVYIVYTVFCKTFSQDNGLHFRDVLVMAVVEFSLICILKALAWWSLGKLFADEPRLRVMGIFGCVEKTVAMGVPLINAIYEHDPNVGLYTLPLLVWHPMQLVIGSYLSPKLANWVEKEEERKRANVTVQQLQC